MTTPYSTLYGIYVEYGAVYENLYRMLCNLWQPMEFCVGQAANPTELKTRESIYYYRLLYRPVNVVTVLLMPGRSFMATERS